MVLFSYNHVVIVRLVGIKLTCNEVDTYLLELIENLEGLPHQDAHNTWSYEYFHWKYKEDSIQCCLLAQTQWFCHYQE